MEWCTIRMYGDGQVNTGLVPFNPVRNFTFVGELQLHQIIVAAQQGLACFDWTTEASDQALQDWCKMRGSVEHGKKVSITTK